MKILSLMALLNVVSAASIVENLSEYINSDRFNHIYKNGI